MTTQRSRGPKPVRGEPVEFLQGPADGIVMRARAPLPARVRYPMPHADHVYVRKENIFGWRYVYAGPSADP